jgi:hypothetical protein
VDGTGAIREYGRRFSGDVNDVLGACPGQFEVSWNSSFPFKTFDRIAQELMTA